MLSTDIGTATPLELSFTDGASTKAARAYVRTTLGAAVATIPLTHVGDGVYSGSWTPLVVGYFNVVYIIYTDGTYVVEDPSYRRAYETIRVFTPEVYAQAVWDAQTSAHHATGTFGAAIETVSSIASDILVDTADILVDLADINIAIAAEAITLGQIKAKTDTIPANTATKTDVTNAQGAILGVDGHTVSDVYNLVDAHTPLSSSDPRLDNLDAKISTRSTLSSSDLAGLAHTSDLTGLAHTTDLANLATKTDLSTLAHSTELATLATKTDLSNSESAILDEIITNRNLIDSLADALALIKAKTDLITNDPATQTALIAAEDAILFAIASIPSGGTGISVAQIWDYYNRRLTTDPASRDDLAPLATKIDLLPLAAKTDLADLSTKSDIAAIDTTLSSVATKDDLLPLATKVDLDPLATHADIATINSEIAALATKDDLLPLATKEDLQNLIIPAVPQYANKMTTTFNPASGIQEVLVWAEKDGQSQVHVTDCTVIVKDSFGATKWTQIASTPNHDGVFRFVNPIVVSSDANYYIIIVIKVDGGFKATQQAFITVG